MVKEAQSSSGEVLKWDFEDINNQELIHLIKGVAKCL